MKKLKAFNMIKKAVVAVMVAVLLSIGIVPGYFQPVYVYADLPDWLRYATTHIATGMGAIVAFTQGEVEQGLRGLYETWQINRVWNQGVSFDTFLLNQLNHDENNNTITVDHDLYELIVEYIKSLQSDPNSGVSTVPYKLLRVDKMTYGEYSGEGSDQYYSKFVASQNVGEKIYSLNDVRNIVDTHRVGAIYNLSNNMQNKFNMGYLRDLMVDYYENNKAATDQRTHFYRLAPFYRQSNRTSKLLINEISTSSGGTQYGYYFTDRLISTEYEGFYFVGSFTNEGSTRDWNLQTYQYDAVNDRLIQCTRNLTQTGSIKLQNVPGLNNESPREIQFDTLAGNTGINTQNYWNSGWGNNQRAFLHSICKDDAWYKTDDGQYYIPLLRSDYPGTYKVFDSTNALLLYIHNGGKSNTSNNVTNNNRTVKNIVINKNTNNITYVYYPDDQDPQYPDGITYDNDGDDSPVVNYDEQFNLIFQKLDQLRVLVLNITENQDSGSESNIDLSTIEAELESINYYLENLNINPEINCPWDESTRNQLLADIATIKSDLASIKTLLQGISNNINTNLPAILEELQDIKDTLDNLEVSGGGLTQTQIDTLINKMNEIKVVIGNNNVTVSGNSCNWSDNDISNLTQKINTILGDMEIIEGYLNYMESNQQDAQGVLSQMLFHVASIDTKMNIKKKVTDTDDNLTWLIHQLTHFLDNEMEIPESIMQMLGIKFPFSIPYILVAVTHLLEAPPQAPVFHVPINLPNVNDSGVVNVESDFFTANTTTPGADYDFVLDFSQFSEVAEAFKFFMLLTWILGLIKLTPAMLGNGKEIVDEK